MFLSGSAGSIAQQCFRDQQSFYIKKFLPEDYIPATAGEEPKVIKFTVGEVKNPISVQSVDGLKIVIYAKTDYAVDEFEGLIGWVPV